MKTHAGYKHRATRHCTYLGSQLKRDRSKRSLCKLKIVHLHGMKRDSGDGVDDFDAALFRPVTLERVLALLRFGRKEFDGHSAFDGTENVAYIYIYIRRSINKQTATARFIALSVWKASDASSLVLESRFATCFYFTLKNHTCTRISHSCPPLTGSLRSHIMTRLPF